MAHGLDGRTFDNGEKLGRHEVDSIHSQPPLHRPSDEAGDGLAVGGLEVTGGGGGACRPRLRLCQPQPFPTSPPLQISASGLCTNPSIRLPISDMNPSALARAGPWRRTLVHLETQQPSNGKLKTDRERLEAIDSSDSADPNGHRAGNDRQCMTARLSAKSKPPSMQAATDSISPPRWPTAAVLPTWNQLLAAFQGTTEAMALPRHRLL